MGKVDAKAIIILVLLIIAGIVFYNYRQTGQWALIPETRSPHEEKLFQMERELEQVNKELKRISDSLAESTSTGGDIWYQDKLKLGERKLKLENDITTLRVVVQKEREAAGKQ